MSWGPSVYPVDQLLFTRRGMESVLLVHKITQCFQIDVGLIVLVDDVVIVEQEELRETLELLTDARTRKCVAVHDKGGAREA